MTRLAGNGSVWRRIVLGAICLGLASAPAALALPAVYVSDGLGPSVSQFDTTFGALSPLSPARVTLPAGQAPSDVAVSPDGRSVYVTNNTDYVYAAPGENFEASDVYQYSVGADGRLTPKTPATVPAPAFATNVVVAPDGGAVYVVASGGTVGQYAADATGALSPLTPRFVSTSLGGSASVLGGAAVSIDGATLWVTDTLHSDGGYDPVNVLERFSIGADRTLTLQQPAWQDNGSDMGAVAVSPDATHGFFLRDGDVWGFTAGAGGQATGVRELTVIAELTRLRDLVVRPGGDALYVSTDSGSIYQFAIDGDGALTPLSPALVTGDNEDVVLGLSVSPDGRTLYGVRPELGQVVQFAIAGDGTLSPRSPATLATGDGPTASAVGPDASLARPSASIVSPADGATFVQGAAVPSEFSCAEGFGGPGTASCVDQDGRPSGAAIDTSTVGTHAFTVTATSLNGQSSSRTASYTIVAGNVAPVAEDQSVTAVEDTSKAITLTATDADGGVLTYSTSQPSHGGVTCHAAACTYDPDSNYHGLDSFDFTVTDDHGATDTGRIDITVVSVNDAPVAQDRVVTVQEDGSGTFGIAATDVDGDTLAATVLSGPSHGSAGCSGLSCTYTPAANYNGSDTFTVTVSDGKGASDTATVSVSVTPVNDPPTAQNVSVATDEDTPVQLALLGADIDGDSLTYTIAGTAPQHGTLTCTGALCTYAPAADYFGADGFTYRVADPSGASTTAAVSITVNSVLDTTSLTVPPVIRILSQPLLKLTIPFEARLTRITGEPLPGKTVSFVTGGQRRCSATTNADGVARCSASLNGLVGALTGFGYSAVFDGDITFAGSSGSGALIG